MDLFRVPKPLFINGKQVRNPSYDKFLKAKDKLSHNTGDFITIYKIITTYAEMMELEDKEKLNNFIHEYFLNQSMLDKITKNFKRVFYKIKDNMRKSNDIINELFPDNDNLNDKIIYEEKLENKILASLLYGYRLNTCNKMNDKLITFFDVNVNISKDSVLANTTHRNMFYYELFIMSGKNDIKIVNLIPVRCKELVEKFI
jgi:HrpA-like RNA helicase